MEFRYPKQEKLKSAKTIGRMFTDGKSVSKYPLRLVYVPVVEGETACVGVSVSKKYFKRAVDRNYYKRLLREAYRLNRAISDRREGYSFMLFYQTKDRLEFGDIMDKMPALLEKFIQSTDPQPIPPTH